MCLKGDFPSFNLNLRVANVSGLSLGTIELQLYVESTKDPLLIVQLIALSGQPNIRLNDVALRIRSR